MPGDGPVTVLGVVPVGPLAGAELRGQALVSYAVRAALALTPDVVVVADSHDAGLLRVLAAGTPVGVRHLDDPDDSAQLARAAEGALVVLHDPRCPLLPVAELQRVAGSSAGAAVGVRPVTDTVKTVAPGSESAVRLVAGTRDREDYRAVCSPLALSPAAVAVLHRQLGPTWWTVDLWVLVAALRPYVAVELVEVSSLGRRVEDEDALWLLECVDDMRLLARES